MKTCRRLLALIALVFVVTAANAEIQVVHFYGYAYDLASGKYLYTEVHNQQIDGDRWIGGEIRYFWPDGQPMGKKTLSFADDHYIPTYLLTLPAADYSEGITAVSKDSIAMFKVSSEKGRQTTTVRKVAAMAADSGFHNYLCDHMDELVAGKTIRFRFAAAGQMDAYNFRARKTGDGQLDGRSVIKVTAEPNSMIRFLADPLLLTYDPQTKHLLEYRGMSNVIDPKTGKAFVVRIDYYGAPPAEVSGTLPPLD